MKLALVLAMCAPAATAAAQDEPDEQTAPRPAPKRQTSRLFPSWPVDGFDWHLVPLVGYTAGSRTTDAGTTVSATTEVGAAAGVSGVPIHPKNPGATASASIGRAWGATATTVRRPGAADIKDDYGYVRTYGTVGLTGYYRMVRQALEIARGRLEYGDASSTVVQSMRVEHDVGVLILPWLSGHYTLTWLRAFSDQYGRGILVEVDHWPHARLALAPLSFRLAAGPGFTQVTEFGPTVKGSTADLRLKTALNIVWKLGADGDVRYVYASSKKELGASAGTRLPEQELSKAPRTVMPEDSMTASYFLGARNLFYGLGVGYQWTIQILNVGEKSGTKRQTTKNAGLTATFSASL